MDHTEPSTVGICVPSGSCRCIEVRILEPVKATEQSTISQKNARKNENGHVANPFPILSLCSARGPSTVFPPLHSPLFFLGLQLQLAVAGQRSGPKQTGEEPAKATTQASMASVTLR